MRYGILLVLACMAMLCGDGYGQYRPRGVTSEDLDGKANNLPTAISSDIFIDTFQRADTGTNAIGTGDTGQTWSITGSGAANVRIVDQGLSLVSPFGTGYYWPQLSFNVQRFGCTFRYQSGGGAGGYVQAMILSKAAESLTDMLHVTWNANNIGVQDWRSGGAGDTIIATETFSAPLVPGTIYTVEVEIVPELDLVILYSPSGKVSWGTHANVSEYDTPYCAFESSEVDAPIYTVSFRETWAIGGSTAYSSIAKLAAAMARNANVSNFVQRNSAGYVSSIGFGSTGQTTVSSAGLISAVPDTDSQNIFGRWRLNTAVGSDHATLSHYDNGNATDFALMQNFAGRTQINAKSGQSIINSMGGVEKTKVDNSGWRVGGSGGFTISGIFSGTTTLSVSALGTGTTYEQLVPVAGALSTGTPSISVGFSGALTSGLVVSGARVVASGTVGVSLYNATGGDVTDTTTVIRATSIQP